MICSNNKARTISYKQTRYPNLVRLSPRQKMDLIQLPELN